MKPLRHILAKLVAGLAILPATRATSVPDTTILPPTMETEDQIAMSEIMPTNFASHHPELWTRYEGPVTDVFAQLDKARGRKLANSCLLPRGTQDATQKFVADRTC